MYESKRSQGFWLVSQGAGNLLQALKRRENESIDKLTVSLNEGLRQLNKLFVKIEGSELVKELSQATSSPNNNEDFDVDDIAKLSSGLELLAQEAHLIYKNKVEEKSKN